MSPTAIYFARRPRVTEPRSDRYRLGRALSQILTGNMHGN